MEDNNKWNPKGTIKNIRKALRRLCKANGCENVKVRMERGTAYGWIRISGTGKYGFTEKQLEVLRVFGLRGAGCNCELISPDNNDYNKYEQTALYILDIHDDFMETYFKTMLKQYNTVKDIL